METIEKEYIHHSGTKKSRVQEWMAGYRTYLNVNNKIVDYEKTATHL
jgi:hypothetical protein